MPNIAFQMDLLSTKLQPPPVQEKRVARTRLLEKLDDSLHQKFTLVCAPAGYGKTTLLSQWVSHRNEPVAWISLDRSDNDLAQFWRYLLAAIQRVDPGVGIRVPEMLQPPQLPAVSTICIALINDLVASGKNFILILDDYQEVGDRAVHEALEYLIEHIPANLHVILATRADPPLPLPRLRARGRLTELRQSDLCFTMEEAAEFLKHSMGLHLSTEDVAVLIASTEGWIAAMQMAAIALRSPLSLQGHHPDLAAQSGFIKSFTGRHRFILEYLVAEVLDQQPPELQAFLLRTSILERLCAELCDAVMDQGESAGEDEPRLVTDALVASQAILERLESSNLFIVPLDHERHWYRYHRLFADLLRKRLGQVSPDLVLALHGRASQWYTKHGYQEAAIEHALLGRHFELAANLVEENVESILMHSKIRTFLNWMERLPNDIVGAHPTLGFYNAWALLMGGHSLEVVERYMRGVFGNQVAAGSTGILAGRLAALYAYLAFFQADIHRAAAFCTQALHHLPESDIFLRSIVTWILTITRLANGELPDGKQALDRVVMMSREIGNPLIAVVALSHRARLQMRQGHLQLARETLEQALHLAMDPQGRRLPVASEALIGLGELERECNNLQEAASLLFESIELARQWSELASFDAYFPLMRVRLAQDDLPAASEALETAWQLAHRSDISQVDDRLSEFQQAFFWVVQGKVAEVRRWAYKLGLLEGDQFTQVSLLDGQQSYVDAHMRKYEFFVLARLFILQGRAAEAFEILERLLEQAKQLDRIDLLIEVQILRALAFQQVKNTDLACESLVEALALAEPGGFMRIFLDEGEPLARLLRQAASRGLAPAYVSKILAAFGEPASREVAAKPASASAIQEPLSDRELEVLRLMASGKSNPEIARELVISVSTVHSHCKNIFSKLDVHRRWDAVQQARDLGVI